MCEKRILLNNILCWYILRVNYLLHDYSFCYLFTCYPFPLPPIGMHINHIRASLLLSLTLKTMDSTVTLVIFKNYFYFSSLPIPMLKGTTNACKSYFNWFCHLWIKEFFLLLWWFFLYQIRVMCLCTLLYTISKAQISLSDWTTDNTKK